MIEDNQHSEVLYNIACYFSEDINTYLAGIFQNIQDFHNFTGHLPHEIYQVRYFAACELRRQLRLIYGNDLVHLLSFVL